jgi:hypothetical protein
MNDKIKDSLKFVVNEIKKISLNKNYSDVVIECNYLLFEIEKQYDLTNKDISILKNEIINLIDKIQFIIKIEIRFVLFPLPDIKKEAYEIGKLIRMNFLEWVNSDDSPEKLMKILEDEVYRLEEVKEILSRLG